MIKVYVCHHCQGTGEIHHIDFDSGDDQIDKCPLCAEVGMPSKITLKGGRGPGANEMEVDATFSVVVPLQFKEQTVSSSLDVSK